MLVRLIVAVLATMLCSSAALAVLPERVHNIENIPVPKADKPLGSAEVRDAILVAATAKQWQLEYLGAGRLAGRLTVRERHVVDVDITYSPERYSIVYRDSLRMDYRAEDNTIHPNYNRWVRELGLAINASLRKTAGSPPRSAGVALIAPPAAPVRLPQAGDTWTYRLSEPRPGVPAHEYRVRVLHATESVIGDALSLDGAAASEWLHSPGGYLVGQGASVFSPYYRDAGCGNVYVCIAKAKVAGSEPVEVPAGRFNAIKVVIEQGWKSADGEPQSGGGRVLTVWYAPEVKRAVKFSSRLVAGEDSPMQPNFDLELTSYTLRQ